MPHLPSLYLAAILPHSPTTTAGYASTCDRLPLAMAPGPGRDVRSETVLNPRDHLPLAPNADAVAAPDRGKLLSLGGLELRLTVT